VSGVIVSNNTFSGYARPIYLHSVGNITIEGNELRDSNFDAIRLRENDGYCLINGNQFINIGDPSWPDTQTRDAVDVYWSGSTLTITNNIVKVTAFAGFDIKGVAADGSYRTQKVIVSNNQIYRTRFSGILIGGYGNGVDQWIDSVIVSDNIITECNQNNDVTDGYGIRVESFAKYINIHDNIVSFCFGRGIMINNTIGSGNPKSVRVAGNLCMNNGRSAVQTALEAGIHINGADGLIVSDNICENDSTLQNPYQACGIFIQSLSTLVKSAVMSNNICRNNTTNQISIEPNLSRADSIAVFRDNIQVGTGAIQRATWQDQRSIFFGNGVPVSGDGNFRVGDEIRNVSPTLIKNISHWKCITAGAPGTWVAYGCGQGTTAQRPTLTTNDAGFSYFDTTLAKAIVWSGSAWLV
jgi:parallel beta-helix repeat protein